MGRFYQTADRNYVDDFIYTPPWELAMAAMAKQEQNVQTSLDTMELMRNLPIKYWKGVDDERANKVKTDWEGKINDLSSNISKDLLNPENRAKLMQLKAELNKDVMTGNIAKLQENANAYEKFEAQRQALKNPADRDMYLKMIQNYKNSSPEGAYSSIFKPDEMYDTVNQWERYMSSDSFKNLEPDEQAQSIENVNGQWMVKTATGSEELSKSKIGQNFVSWLGNQSDVKGYAANRQKYNNEQWLDENGNYRTDENSMIGNMLLNGVQSMAYSKKTSQRDLDVNQFAMQKMQQDFQASENAKERAHQDRQRKASEAAVAAATGTSQQEVTARVPEFVKKTNSLIRVSAELQKELQSKFGRLAKSFGTTPEEFVHKVIANKEQYRKQIPTIYAEAVAFNTKVQQNKYASREMMVGQFGVKQTDYMEKQLNKNLGHNTKMSLPLADGTTTGKRYNLSQINSGTFILDGVKVARGSAKFGSDATYVPGDSIEGSVVVKPVHFKDMQGVEHTTYTYMPLSDFLGPTK